MWSTELIWNVERIFKSRGRIRNHLIFAFGEGKMKATIISCSRIQNHTIQTIVCCEILLQSILIHLWRKFRALPSIWALRLGKIPSCPLRVKNNDHVSCLGLGEVGNFSKSHGYRRSARTRRIAPQWPIGGEFGIFPSPRDLHIGGVLGIFWSLRAFVRKRDWNSSSAHGLNIVRDFFSIFLQFFSYFLYK